VEEVALLVALLVVAEDLQVDNFGVDKIFK